MAQPPRAQPPMAQPPMAQPPQAGTIISVNSTQQRKMSTGKKITDVAISNPAVVEVRAVRPDTVAIVGVAAGIATITLTDEDGKTEKFDIVVVQFDIQQLRNVLRQAVPTANVTPIPAGNNAVILQGTVDRAEDLPLALQAAQSVVGGVQVINALRVGGVQQVQLDVVVAQVSRSELRSMAFNFFASSENFFIGSTVGQAVANPALIGGGSQFLNASGVLSGAPGAPNGLPTNLLLGVVHDNWGFLNFLQALRQEGLLKLQAEPRLVTMSGRLASFLSGGEQAIPVPAGLGQVGVQFEEFGTRLNFVPIVLGNGKIHLEVEPEVSALDPASGTNIQGTVVPGRSTQRVRTTVELESGQSFVIGGLIQHTVNGSTLKTPILGDLPFIGAAFNSKVYNEIETELIIVVTPHLVDPLDCSQFPKCLPGKETRSPDDFELFLEGILEAPRGPRQVFPGGHYEPAYRNSPTAGLFPCGDAGAWGHGGASCGPCAGGACNVHAVSTGGTGVPPMHGTHTAAPASEAAKAATALGMTEMPRAVPIGAADAAPLPPTPPVPAELPGATAQPDSPPSLPPALTSEVADPAMR